ncbi:MAG: hypothetical protein WCG75_09380 [Armatimonadota bacterium]
MATTNIHFSTKATAFGKSLAAEFQKSVAAQRKVKARLTEVSLFRAFMKSFTSTTGLGFIIDEYHGAVSQVEFSSVPGKTRGVPRCELCDVLLIVFSTTGEIRLSFLQAKAKASSAPYPLHFENLEQHVLLAERPKITKWKGSIVWPDEILHTALAPSIGSVGIFTSILTSPGFHYSRAIDLKPGKVRHGKLWATGNSRFYSASVMPKGKRKGKPKLLKVPTGFDITHCGSIRNFGCALASLYVGTPIHEAADASSKPTATGLRATASARQSIANWLGGIKDKNALGQAAEELLITLKVKPEPGVTSAGMGTKRVLVIRIPEMPTPRKSRSRGV